MRGGPHPSTALRKRRFVPLRTLAFRHGLNGYVTAWGGHARSPRTRTPLAPCGR